MHSNISICTKTREVGGKAVRLHNVFIDQEWVEGGRRDGGDIDTPPPTSPTHLPIPTMGYIWMGERWSGVKAREGMSVR